MKNHNYSNIAIAVLLLSFATAAAQTDTPFIIPIDDPRIDLAAQCLLDTRVLRFVADPVEVEPFASTTFSWEVATPAGCSIALSIAGRSVSRVGTLDVTPVHANNSFGLVGSMLGLRGVLASVPVSVDQSTCRSLPIPESLIAPRIEAAIDEFDEEDDAIRQIERPRIQIQSSGLSIHMVVKADISGFRDPTVTLDMGLRFTVRDGVIQPRYTFFRPNAETVLPDDFVQSKFFERADSILADFRRGFNEGLAEIVSDNEQLFDLTTEPFELRATLCAIEPPPEPRLTVRLRVIPPEDPGRFNLRVDGVTRAPSRADGGSTGALEVSQGTHTVSQSPVAPTNLADYRTFISGDCAPDGRVTVSRGEAKICFITNLAQENPEQCEDECRKERDECQKDGASTPAICAALFRACMNTCN